MDSSLMKTILTNYGYGFDDLVWPLHNWKCEQGGLMNVSCPRASVALDHPVAVESPCWTIFQQDFSALLHSLYPCAWVESWVASAPLSTCRTLLSSLPCKPVLATWYWPSYLVCGGHPSWPLEVTWNSGFFKVVHYGYGNFVAIISSSNHASHACGDTAFFSSLEWSGHSLLKSVWWHRVWMRQYPV